MKIAVIGPDPLGYRIVQKLIEPGLLEVVPLNDREINITNQISIAKCFGYIKPNLVINCLEYSLVDRAQNEPRKALFLNRDGPTNLADSCKVLNIPLIHFSTDYIFGQSSGMHRAYNEQDQSQPVNIYGASKFEGEEAVRHILREHLIFRTSWMFDSIGSNFVKTIVNLVQTRNEIRIVSDQQGTPTWTEDLANVIIMIVKRIYNKEEIPWGTYNYSGNAHISRYEFVLEIIEQMNKILSDKKNPTVIPISSEEYPLPAKRPYWSVLDCTKFINTFGVETKDWKIGLYKVLQDLLK